MYSSPYYKMIQRETERERERERDAVRRSSSSQAFRDAALRAESERWGEEEEERDPEGLTAVAALLRACQG